MDSLVLLLPPSIYLLCAHASIAAALGQSNHESLSYHVFVDVTFARILARNGRPAVRRQLAMFGAELVGKDPPPLLPVHSSPSRPDAGYRHQALHARPATSTPDFPLPPQNF